MERLLEQQQVFVPEALAVLGLDADSLELQLTLTVGVPTFALRCRHVVSIGPMQK